MSLTTMASSIFVIERCRRAPHPSVVSSERPSTSQFGGPLLPNSPRPGPEPHCGGSMSDALHFGQHPPLDHHRRGVSTSSPILVHLPRSSLQDPKRCGSSGSSLRNWWTGEHPRCRPRGHHRDLCGLGACIPGAVSGG
jgi:hypothetical protein